MSKRKSSSSSGGVGGGEKGKERKRRNGTAFECRLCALVPVGRTPSPPLKQPLTVIDKVRNKLQSDSAALPISEGKDTQSGSWSKAAQQARSQASAVPSPAQNAAFLQQFHGPSWPLGSGPFWNHELLPAFNVPAPEGPRAPFPGRPNPRGQPRFRRR